MASSDVAARTDSQIHKLAQSNPRLKSLPFSEWNSVPDSFSAIPSIVPSPLVVLFARTRSTRSPDNSPHPERAPPAPANPLRSIEDSRCSPAPPLPSAPRAYQSRNPRSQSASPRLQTGCPARKSFQPMQYSSSHQPLPQLPARRQSARTPYP